MSDYRIDIFYSEEDNGHIAEIPDLDSCYAFGRSPQEELREVLQARDAWLWPPPGSCASPSRGPARIPLYTPAVFRYLYGSENPVFKAGIQWRASVIYAEKAPLRATR